MLFRSENKKDVEETSNIHSGEKLTADVPVNEKTDTNKITENIDVVSESKELKKEEIKPIVYDNPILKEIDDARLTFRKFYKLTEILKWVVTAVVLGMIVTSFILFANLKNGITYMLVGTAIALVVLVAYTFIVGTLKKKKMELYFNSYYANINKFVYPESFLEMNSTPNGKIELTDFTNSNLYANVYAVPSRNLTTFKYMNTNFLLADCAAQVKDKKKLVPVFVGKLLSAPNTYEEEDAVYVYFTCKKEIGRASCRERV